MFTFSGCYHAFSKLKTDTRDQYLVQHQYATANIDFNFNRLQAVAQKPIYNVGLVTMDTSVYWQVNVKEVAKKTAALKQPKDLIKEMAAPAPVVVYINAASWQVLPEGEKEYAQYLASVFSKHQKVEIKSASVITKFEGEYGFVNKRLPVWKISYAVNNNERYYVETSTGKLGVRIDDKELWEANSFNYFHKHHFMDFAGKSWRDFSTMFWVAAQIAMVIIGLILWQKKRKRNLPGNG